MFFYLLTFALGFALDFAKHESRTLIWLRRAFVIWLYIFLCFGYMTGSDWRSYELTYQSIHKMPFFFDREVGFFYLFRALRYIISDYWLAVGILKCIYLYTILRVVKRLTPYWLSVVSLLMTGGLTFILINNPLRFMVALIFVNIAVELLLDKKYWIAVALLVVSFFFHNTCIFFLLIIPLALYAHKISTLNRAFLSVLYAGVVFLSSQSGLIEGIRSSVIGQFMLFNEGIKDYSTYTVEDNSSFFTIGNMIGIFFFFLVIFSRDKVVEKYENGKFIYGFTIVYLFFARILIMIPTGFRLNIPFEVFYMVYVVYLIRSKHFFRWFFIVYFCVAFPRNLWNTYVYIPYSNSIPYIIKGHKPYMERNTYNIGAYQERTGKLLDKD